MIDASKKYLCDMAVGMSHPKVNLYVGDGLEYLQKNEAKFDVIIADLSDPGEGSGCFNCSNLSAFSYSKRLFYAKYFYNDIASHYPL